MADWSELPSEPLQLISQKLNNSELYLLRFRSVCSSWRRSSSSLPKCHHNHLPSGHPQFPDTVENICSLPKQQNIFVIKPPATITQQQTLQSLVDQNRSRCIRQKPYMHPFDVQLKCALYSAPCHFVNRLIDFNQLSVLHLENRFHIHGLYFRHPKVVVQMCEAGQPIAILTYDQFEVPMILQCEDDSWKSIPTMPKSSWGNICLFKGQPCVADENGCTLMIGENSSVLLLANPVFGGNVKFLVESEYDLLSVDCYQIDTRPYIWFDVYRLDEKGKKKTSKKL